MNKIQIIYKIIFFLKPITVEVAWQHNTIKYYGILWGHLSKGEAILTCENIPTMWSLANLGQNQKLSKPTGGTGADGDLRGGTCLKYLWASQTFSPKSESFMSISERQKKVTCSGSTDNESASAVWVIENSPSQRQGQNTVLGQLFYHDRCATSEKRVGRRQAAACKTPQVRRGLAAKEVAQVD